jgi:hypothetical protein
MRGARLGGAIVAMAALALPLVAAPQPGVASQRGASSGAMVSPPLSASQRGAVAAARQATRKYHSPDVARKNGYAILRDVDGIACISMPGMGAMGVHLANGELVADPAVQLRKPEALVYARDGSGKRRLVALEYVVLKKDWDSVHGHNAPRPKLFGHRFNVTPAGNRFGLPRYYSLHAWIWKHNPAGMFEMWNPNVHCPR